MMRCLFFCVLLLSGPAAAQDLSFQIAPTESCLWDSGNTGEKRACIGRAAAACMEQPGGSSTVAMGFCLDQELAYWDDMLNDAYGQLMQAALAFGYTGQQLARHAARVDPVSGCALHA